MKWIFFVLIIYLAIVSCNTKNKRPSSSGIKIETRGEKDSVIVAQDSVPILLKLVNGEARATISKLPDQTVYIEFDNVNYNALTAYLSSVDSLANIRFSQIFLPDGTMDGPFGREITYEMPLHGSYRILIHENMMAGDPWGGIFNVRIILKNK